MSGPAPTVYRQRWLVLAAFGLLSFSNAMLWITLAPIATLAQEHYGVSSLAINALAMVYLVVYPLGALPTAALLEAQGLRRAVVLGAALNAAGAALRMVPFGEPVYAPVLAGQLLAAVAQLVVLATPALIAAAWFPPSERVLATGIGGVLNQVGVGVGYYLPSLVVRSDPDNIAMLLLVEAAIAVAALAAVATLFHSKPPTPPSASAAVLAAGSSEAAADSPLLVDEASSGFEGLAVVPGGEIPVSFVGILKRMLADRAVVVLMLAFGLAVGSFYTFAAVLEQLLERRGYSDDTVGALGTASIAAGVPGAILLGYAADKTQRYRELILACLVCSAGALLLFTLMLVPDQTAALAAATVLVGFALTAIIPISLDCVVELTFPMSPKVTTMVLTTANQISGMAFILGTTLLMDTGTASAWLLAAANAVAAAVFLLGFRGSYRRLELEKGSEPSA